MPYTNPKELLTAATALPAAIEAKLPAGAPKVSTMLLDATVNMPVLPDFPVAIPDLPAVPAFPDMPWTTEPVLGKRYVTDVEVKPATSQPAPLSRKPLGKEILS